MENERIDYYRSWQLFAANATFLGLAAAVLVYVLGHAAPYSFVWFFALLALVPVALRLTWIVQQLWTRWPAISIHPQGFIDRRRFSDWVLWDDVKKIEIEQTICGPFIFFAVDKPDEYLRKGQLPCISAFDILIDNLSDNPLYSGTLGTDASPKKLFRELLKHARANDIPVVHLRNDDEH